MSPRTIARSATFVVAMLAVYACAPAPAHGDEDSARAPLSAVPDSRDVPESPDTTFEAAALVTGKPCDTVATAAEEIAEQATATVPLVEGLTLGHIWVGPDSGTTDFDHECLSQVTAVEPNRVVLLSRCADPRDSSGVRRRTQLCRADLRDGAIYRTEFGVRIPDLVVGSTLGVLSRRAFRELRDRGSTHIRQVHLRASTWQDGAAAPDPDATVYVTEDVAGELRRTRTGTTRIQLNDSLVELPVIYADITLHDLEEKKADQLEHFIVLDDARVPIVLDNQRVSTAAGIRIVRITWPERRSIERDLERARESVVYGIYFDYNSAVLRAESDLVLQEIAEVLRAHADWTLRIEGHTDSIGGAAFNQDLSVRRAQAVRTALGERFGIDVSRLSTSGAGASRPVDRNDTPEGRARNRRVELTRP